MPPMPPPPPRPPTTSARQPCTGSPHPSHCPGGCRSPPTPRAYPRAPAPGHPRWPPRAAASSWWRTDSTLRRKSGRSTPPPTASCSRTLWGAEPLWGLQECDERDPRSLCPSLRASGTPPLLDVCVLGATIFAQLVLSLGFQPASPHRPCGLRMWAAHVQVWARRCMCEVTKPHPRWFPVFKSSAPQVRAITVNKNGFSDLGLFFFGGVGAGL